MERQMREQQGIQAAGSAAEYEVSVPLCSQSLVYGPVGGSRILIYLQEHPRHLEKGCSTLRETSSLRKEALPHFAVKFKTDRGSLWRPGGDAQTDGMPKA